MTEENPEQEKKETKIEKKPFKWQFHPRLEFRDWMKEQFPELKEYASSDREYETLMKRIHEVHEAAMSILILVMEHSGYQIREYYSQDLNNLRKAYYDKNFQKYTRHLDALVDAIDVE